MDIERSLSVEWNCDARDLLDNFCSVIYTVTHFCTEMVEVTDEKSCQFLLCKEEFSYGILLHVKYVEICGSNVTTSCSLYFYNNAKLFYVIL